MRVTRTLAPRRQGGTHTHTHGAVSGRGAAARSGGAHDLLHHRASLIHGTPAGGRYHAVLNLDAFTLAATRNLLSRRMLAVQSQPSYPEPFPRKYPEIAAYFREALALGGGECMAEELQSHLPEADTLDTPRL